MNRAARRAAAREPRCDCCGRPDVAAITIACPDCDYRRIVTSEHPMFSDWTHHGVPPWALLCPNCDEGWRVTPPRAS